MNTDVKEITINGVDYVPKGSQLKPAESYNGMKYVIVRNYVREYLQGMRECGVSGFMPHNNQRGR